METIKCKFCGEVLNEEEALVFDGAHMCGACERAYLYCLMMRYMEMVIFSIAKPVMMI